MGQHIFIINAKMSMFFANIDSNAQNMAIVSNPSGIVESRADSPLF